MLASFEAIYGGLDRHLSRSILIGAGGALIGFVLGMYSVDAVTRWWTSASLPLSSGSTPQMAAAKAIVNFFGSSAIKLMACALGWASWFNVAFNAATAERPKEPDE